MPTLTVYIAASGTPIGVQNGVVQTSLTGHMWYSIGNNGSNTSFGFAPVVQGQPL